MLGVDTVSGSPMSGSAGPAVTWMPIDVSVVATAVRLRLVSLVRSVSVTSQAALARTLVRNIALLLSVAASGTRNLLRIVSVSVTLVVLATRIRSFMEIVASVSVSVSTFNQLLKGAVGRIMMVLAQLRSVIVSAVSRDVAADESVRTMTATADDRSALVPADNRGMAVPSENRTMTADSENRSMIQ